MFAGWWVEQSSLQRNKPFALISTNCLKVSFHNKPVWSSWSCQRNKGDKCIYRPDETSAVSTITPRWYSLTSLSRDAARRKTQEKKTQSKLIEFTSSCRFVLSSPPSAETHLGGSCRVSNHSLPLWLKVSVTSSSHRISSRKGKCHTRTWWRPDDQERVTESFDFLSTLNLPNNEEGEKVNQS